MLTAMIFAKDHDAALTFYQQGFDLRVEDASSSEGYTVLVGDGVRMSIHAVPPAVAGAITITDPPRPRSDSALKLLFEVGDLATTRGRLEGLGAQFFGTATAGGFDACDVEGNVFGVAPRSAG